jgi:predicted ATPase/class 3 adenylate cyclase
VDTRSTVELPTGVVTFLHTDIEDSSGWWEREPIEMRRALADHDELVAEVVAANGGAVVKHLGDGCWAAFSSPSEAVAAAIEFQRRLQQTDRAGGLQLSVRVGVHTGEIEPTERDYFGPVVNRAARIVELANGDQIVCSSATAALLQTALLPKVELRSEGPHELRGIGTEEVFMVLADGVETSDRPLRRPITPTNLPRPKTSLVGREDDITRAAAFIEDDDALVTLIGPGGVGKTRLAIEVATRAAESFREQVHFVDLVPVSSDAALVEMVAEAIGARRQPGMDLVDSIADYLTGRRTLLILDNCEHLIEAVREFVIRLVDVGGVHVLATSREALGVPDEQQIIVSPLDVETAGVELFVDRARRREHRFELNADNEAGVRAVARHLDGIPLAIELAAARIRLMTPAEIADRLSSGIDVLDRGVRGERHETMRDTIRWSYNLLGPAEAALFTRSSVFAGGFDLEAAEAVCADDTLVTRSEVPQLIMALLDKSMIDSHDIGGKQRFRMLEPLREFASDELVESDDTEQYRDRHATFYLDLAQRESGRFFSPAEPDVWRVLDVEWSNFRTALDTFERARDLDSGADLVLALAWFAAMSMRFELFGWATELLDAPGAEQHRRFTDLCGAVAMKGYFTLDGQVAERAEIGLSVDPSDPEGLCRCALASVFLNNEHTAEASDAVTSAWLANDPVTIGSRLWANGFRVFHLCIHDPGPEMAERAAAVTKLAEETGSVTARAIAAWANGQVESFVDLDQGMQTWRDGREWAASLPSEHLADQMLVGLLLHVTARRGELSSTLVGCRDALRGALDLHYYAAASHLFGVTAIALSRAGDARTGARLLGSMIENGHIPRRNATHELEAALGDELEDFMVMGQSLSVTQAGRLAIDALEQAIALQPADTTRPD